MALDNYMMFRAIAEKLGEGFNARLSPESQADMARVGVMITSAEYQTEFNVWLDGFINRIGETIMVQRNIRNPLSRFMGQTMEYGVDVQEYAIALTEEYRYEGPELYSPPLGEKPEGANCQPNPWCKTKPTHDVHYHRRNRESQYETTYFKDELKKAFLEPYGLDRLINDIVATLSDSNVADEFLYMKRILSEYINNSTSIPLQTSQIITLPAVVDRATGEEFIKEVQQKALDISFNTGAYNPVGYVTANAASSATLLMSKNIIPTLNVDTMAGAFNQERLGLQFDTMPLDDFGPNTEDVMAMLIDNRFFIVRDNLKELSSIWNPKGRYWNFFYTVFQLYACSYFRNALIFKETP